MEAEKIIETINRRRVSLYEHLITLSEIYNELNKQRIRNEKKIESYRVVIHTLAKFRSRDELSQNSIDEVIELEEKLYKYQKDKRAIEREITELISEFKETNTLVDLLALIAQEIDTYGITNDIDFGEYEIGLK